MGGVGKTTLAVEYIYQRQHEYDVVWWIPAERTAQISQSLAELALRLGIDFNGGAPDVNSIVVAVLESLRTGVPYVDWLLVFDNAESPDAVSQFLPASGTGNVLITSRNPQWAALARPLEVDVFQREESKSLLKVRGREIDDENADRLAEALGDLPMAIEQAAAWHAETGMRVEEYLRLLDEKQIDLLQGTAPTDGGHPAIAAWNISLDELESRNPAAYQLLQVCSCYAPEPISRSLFTPRSCEAISPELDAVLGDPIRLGQAIREVGRYSLARFHHHANSLQMHRLVRAALQLRMTEDDQAVIRRGAHLLLAASDPNDPGNTACWPRYAKLYPHVIVSGAVSSAESQVRGLVVNETIYLLRWGDYETGHDLAHTAHEAWARTLGMDHPHTLQIARWQGFLLFSLGRYQEAAELNANVLEAYRRSAGPEHQDTVDALGNVALDHRVRGDFTEALRLSDSVHQKYLRLLGPDDPETLRAAYNLAVSLRLTGDFAQARLLDEQTWRSYTLVYGHNRVESLRTWFGLALDMRELGEYSAALIRHREIYEQAIELVGRDNPLTLSVLRYLSVALRQAGLHAEALSTAERAHADLVRYTPVVSAPGGTVVACREAGETFFTSPHPRLPPGRALLDEGPHNIMAGLSQLGVVTIHVAAQSVEHLAYDIPAPGELESRKALDTAFTPELRDPGEGVGPVQQSRPGPGVVPPRRVVPGIGVFAARREEPCGQVESMQKGVSELMHHSGPELRRKNILVVIGCGQQNTAERAALRGRARAQPLTTGQRYDMTQACGKSVGGGRVVLDQLTPHAVQPPPPVLDLTGGETPLCAHTGHHRSRAQIIEGDCESDATVGNAHPAQTMPSRSVVLPLLGQGDRSLIRRDGHRAVMCVHLCPAAGVTTEEGPPQPREKHLSPRNQHRRPEIHPGPDRHGGRHLPHELQFLPQRSPTRETCVLRPLPCQPAHESHQPQSRLRIEECGAEGSLARTVRRQNTCQQPLGSHHIGCDVVHESDSEVTDVGQQQQAPMQLRLQHEQDRSLVLSCGRQRMKKVKKGLLVHGHDFPGCNGEDARRTLLAVAHENVTTHASRTSLPNFPGCLPPWTAGCPAIPRSGQAVLSTPHGPERPRMTE
ncbi:hypothetical protein AQI94_37570 [Streptomyces pseudovenezuelae]|uniref:NB-ARC domain-containing protein n=1 Tax=Streptomyces pseudovenezuelae TaxID=67350 RepID=A0A101MYF8_9ACTN|nr:hypothetical protein AQI94_37570 [Streptomyces pseudovenezuelae]